MSSPAVTYNTLRQEVTEILNTGKLQVQQALENQLISTYHAVGQRLHDHIEAGGYRAEYGAQVINQLSSDVGLGQRQLYDCLRFYRHYPQIPSNTTLSWSHYRIGLALPTPDDRQKVLDTAQRQKWTVRELQSEIKARSKSEPKPESERTPNDHLPALRGRLHTYKIVDGQLDLGFHIYRSYPNLPDSFTVQLVQTDTDTQLLPAEDRRDTHFTYHATLKRVIDGDTLHLNIDCGFDTWTRQRIRLHGIDTPELDTPQGERIYRYVQSILHNATLVITTIRPDKYGRYLADVFYLPGDEAPQTVLETGTFLNRHLIQKSLAKRV